MTGLVLGARLTRSRLARGNSAIAVGTAALAVAMVALVLRRADPSSAPDQALTGVALGFVLPLLAYGSVARALEATRLEHALAELARYGANRRGAALGLVTAVATSLALAGALLAAVAVVVTRAPADPRLLADLGTSAWIGALAGAAYASLFCLASTFGARGGGRFWALVLDWVLGAGTTAVALPWPRGHVQNLLGAVPVLGMPQWAASVALLLLTAIFAGLTLWRTQR